MRPTCLALASFGVAIPVSSAVLFLVSWFGYTSFPTLWLSIFCPSYGILIVAANVANILVPRWATKRLSGPYWLANWLSVTTVLSGIYLSAHVVFTAIFVSLGLRC